MAEEEEKKEKKKLSREEKKALKEAKKNMAEEEEFDDDSGSNKVIVVLVTLVILIIWLGIIAILIKCDVGGFGSTVLYPTFKDVPYINQILPDVKTGLEEEDTQYQFDSLDDAIERIKELEAQNAALQVSLDDYKKLLEEASGQADSLADYRQREAEFEAIKEKFYEEVVFSDNSPDINEYKVFYESIEPENAEILYKQVVEQLQYKEDISDYVKAYSSMKPKKAAAIFNTMTDDLDLVAAILKEMSASARGDILAEMNADTAAKVTEIMNPSKK